ncbi:MAG: BatD family protein [Phycisphaerales bacterium]|nr:BatD family protein [Phycisphaerales bacterium]
MRTGKMMMRPQKMQVRVNQAGRLAWVLAAMWIAGRAYAQTTVTIEPPRGDVYANEPFTINVIVQNFTDCGQPEFPEIPNATIEKGAGGESTQTTIVNGRMRTTRTRTFEYRVTISQVGELVIAPVKIEVDGKRLGTRALRLDILPSDSQERFFVEIAGDVERAYVGQKVQLTLAIWIEPATFNGELISAGGMYSCLQRGELGPFAAPTVESAVQKSRVGRDGAKRTYYVFTSTNDYVAERAGPLAFPEIRVEASYPTKIVRDVFRELRVSAARTLRARASGPGVNVLPLPIDGRPANFSGAVGRFTVTASARPTQVRVGDPIELTVEVRGDGPLDTLPAPLLASDEHLSKSFRVPRETLTGETVGRVRRFKQTIRPISADVRDIPAIEYPYFDPFDGKYAIARTQPIALTVTGGESLEIAAPEVEAPGEPLEEIGYRGNETSIAALLRSVPPVSVSHVVAAVAGPPAAISAFWTIGALVKARRVARGARRARAATAARKRILAAGKLAPRDAAHEIMAALSGYLGDRTGQAAARFQGRSSVEFLRERRADSLAVDQLSRLIERCEALSFGGAAGADSAQLAHDAAELLSLLERESAL